MKRFFRRAALLCTSVAVALGALAANAAEPVIGSQGVAGTPLGKQCVVSPYLKQIEIDLAEEYINSTNGDLYIRCMWASKAVQAPPKTEIGFHIMCPGNMNIVHSGFVVGSLSLDYVRITGAVAVPLVNGTDSAQVSAYVEDPAKPFQLFTTALCR